MTSRSEQLYGLAMDAYWDAQQNDEGDNNATLKAIAEMIADAEEKLAQSVASSFQTYWKPAGPVTVPDDGADDVEPVYTGPVRSISEPTKHLTLPGI